MTEGICPSGWHIPSDEEFTQLTDFLGGEGVAGGKMKEAGYDHWNSPNTGATNSSGWTGLPGGATPVVLLRWFRLQWTLTATGGLLQSPVPLVVRSLDSNTDNVIRFDYYRSYGKSARCVRDD